MPFQGKYGHPGALVKRDSDAGTKCGANGRDQPSRLICSSVTTRSSFSVLLLMR
jgi:hypothetical protein